MANGLSHADGKIYEHFLGTYCSTDHYYTVQQLDAKGLWTRIDNKTAQQGGCAP